jgi:hypothetical protein
MLTYSSHLCEDAWLWSPYCCECDPVPVRYFIWSDDGYTFLLHHAAPCPHCWPVCGCTRPYLAYLC